MSILFSRQTIIPVWLMGFGLFALFAPVTFATGMSLLIVGAVVPAIILLLWKEPSPTVAEVLHQGEAPPTE